MTREEIREARREELAQGTVTGPEVPRTEKGDPGQVRPRKQMRINPADLSLKFTSRGGYVGTHATSFKDFLLKDELLRAINEAGFENPSQGLEVSSEKFTHKSTTRMHPHCCLWN